MTTTIYAFQVGDVVRYRDICNDMTFIVIGRVAECQWNPYTLRNTETFDVIKTDMRQAGWSLVAR